METVWLIQCAAFGAFVVFVLVCAYLHIRGRRVVPSRYEWLEVLSYSEWKSSHQLRKEMEKLKGTSWGGAFVDSDMRGLLSEFLVEERESSFKSRGAIFTRYEYRITSSGDMKKYEMSRRRKERHDSGLQIA